ncbi:mhpA [Aspergillus parasiticus SU-1]|uniref:MhpA n=1 Tax=Aspergillus parasiticus (strain ATCC 56775 / NRRL 5862 / SRRC 143 / SU-1) TaxID=1403190 RepID=A0A0F0I4X4_ASPPU|nr:mhpA [Aspergillus parasiticus SU-1]
MENYEQTDVLICGCGPTGAMLSGYLGKMGIRNIVLEKEACITTDPRGIALDDDGIRALQGLGLYEHVFSDIGSPIPRIRFVGGVHHDLHRKPFLSFDTASSEGNTGHIGAMRHKQPALERHLRSVIDSSKFSELRSNCTLSSIHEDDNWVYATYSDSTTNRKGIQAKFLIGADGKTGYTRKNYLEPKGIKLEWAEKTKYNETWVALNWKIHLPTPATHPQFPLWKLGYSPEMVYDLFFPDDFQFLCNARRPAVCGRFGLPNDRLWRFEFVIAPGEDGTEMAQRHKIKEVVVPYITHPGSRYGLTEDVEYPEDCIEVLRSRPFGFAARSCNKWALGRTILCGDAAHVFPPFGGQGIASGFRDAIGLAWRLAILCSSKRPLDHEATLAAWYKERKQQLDKSLAATVRNGEMVNTKNSLEGFLRDWTLWSAQFIPQWKHWLERGPRAEGPIEYSHTPGLPFIPKLNGGVAFPQIYCVAVSDKDEIVRFTDDAIFDSSKTKQFQIVVLLPNLQLLHSTLTELGGMDQDSTSLLSYDEVTILVPRVSAPKFIDGQAPETVTNRLYRSASAEEFGQCKLCRGRPAPRGYDEELMWRSMSGKRYIILRPDRFVFAACNTTAELNMAAKELEKMFS